MYPTLFTVGKVSIPTYTVLLDLGLILGLLLTYLEGKRVLGRAETALDLGLWTVIGGILGGRIGYVLANLSAFSENWVQVVQIWKGGLAFHGAFLGGLVVLGAFALLQRRSQTPASFWQLADVVTPGLALGLVFGWAACLMGGCSYGAVGRGLGTLVMPDLFGIEAPRYATQLFGLAFAAILFILFWLLRRRWPFGGAAFMMFCLLYFGWQFFLEFTRGDEAIYLGPFRLAQALDLAIALLAAIGLLVLWWRAVRAEPDETEDSVEAEELEVASAVEESAGPEALPEESPAHEGEPPAELEQAVEPNDEANPTG
jgi:phosphatidylglycerol:prolipoprotein diacylglycerol transferase